MNFIDLHTQYKIIKDEINQSINSILDRGAYIMGQEVFELEKQLADYVGQKYCITCSSGTDALLMPLMAWNISPGDAVFTSPFTFFATAEVIRMVGATPVFVDIDPVTYNIDPQLLRESIKKIKLEGKLIPKAIIPVDLFGLCADYDEIIQIASDFDLLLLEDAAQSFGATYKGQKSCSFGNCAATSFYPAKPLGCYGDGGAIFTSDDELYKKLISIRVHGQGEDKYNNERIGINGRLDTIQAAVLIAKMKLLDSEIKERNIIAQKYNSLLNKRLLVPEVPLEYTSAWAQYSVLADNTEHRTILINQLKDNNIPTAIYYTKPLHLQDALIDLNYKEGDFPNSELVASRIFSLPMHPYLTDSEIELICKTIKNIQ